MPGSALQEVGREEGTGEEEGRDEGRAGRTKKLVGAEMQEKERRKRLRSLWDCVQGRPSWFLHPLVPLCPPPCVSGCKVTALAQITSVACNTE